MNTILIKNATIICKHSKHHLKTKDILIKDGMISKIKNNISSQVDIMIDKENMYVSMGWMDLFANFCDPGYEQKETLQSGIEVAKYGGYTDVCVIPNTYPTISNKTSVEYIKNKNKIVNIHPLGAVSKQIEGKELAEMYDMRLAGAVAFTDGISPIQQAGLLLKALQYVKTFDGIIIEIPEDKNISKDGLMNEGIVSTQIGMQGKPSIAEDIHTYRNIELLKYTQSKLHLTGISTAKSIELIREAKKEKLNITCSVTPYHLLYNDTMLESYNSIFKVNPPLRSEKDRLALIEAIIDGTIDCIASHHSPQHWDNKQVEFEYAKNGMITLQTMLPMLLQISEKISLEKWIELLTNNPRKIVNIEEKNIEENMEVCFTIFDIESTWTLNEKTNKSISNNTPLFDTNLKGKIIATFNNKQYFIHE